MNEKGLAVGLRQYIVLMQAGCVRFAFVYGLIFPNMFPGSTEGCSDRAVGEQSGSLRAGLSLGPDRLSSVATQLSQGLEGMARCSHSNSMNKTEGAAFGLMFESIKVPSYDTDDQPPI